MGLLARLALAPLAPLLPHDGPPVDGGRIGVRGGLPTDELPAARRLPPLVVVLGDFNARSLFPSSSSECVAMMIEDVVIV